MKPTTKAGKRVSGLVLGLVFGLLWSSITLVADSAIVWSAFRQMRALRYSTVAGRITSSRIDARSGSRGPLYRAEIKYAYSVAGKRYEGTRYRYGEVSSGGKSAAARVVALYPVGKQIDVRYAPNDPADAVLNAGLEGSDLLLAAFLLPFNLIMVGIWSATIGSIRHRLFRPVAGGAKILNDGRCVRVRLSPWTPLCIGAAVSGVLAFLSAFVVAFGFGWNPRLDVPIVAWGLILSGSGIAYAYAKSAWVRGGSDLVIDDSTQSIVLPMTYGRTEQAVVPWKSIVAIDVERIEKHGSRGSTYSAHVPTLTIADNDGAQQRREQLTEFWDKASAEGLVDWIRERLRQT
ncbi:MAG: DUF3592 domain-containing protein [Planctomycetaceae bacterium]|nr:DUF3592 domain-containing protein [Planctomycetaceae bacterium]